MNWLARARKNISLKFAAEILTRAWSFLFVVLVARYLGDQDYGKYALAYYLAGLFTIVVDCGLNIVLVRDVSRQPDLLESYSGNIFSLKLLIAAAVMALSAPALWLMGYEAELVAITFLSILYLCLNHLLDFMVAITNSLQHMEFELLIKGAYKTLTVLLPLMALWLGFGLWGFLLALAGSYGLSFLMSGWIIRSRLVRLRWQRRPGLWRQLLRSGFPIGLSALFASVYVRIDIVMLSLMNVSTAEIGWYSIPVKTVEMCSLVPFLVMSGLFPIFAILKNQDFELFKKTYQRSLIYLTGLALPLALSFAFLADPWLPFFFGPSFVKAAASLKIIIWVVPFIFVNFVFIHTLLALNQEKRVTLACALAVVFNVGLNLWALPRYGYLGASATTVVTEIFLSAFYLASLQRLFYDLPWIKLVLKFSLAAGLMALPLWALHPVNSLLAWAASLGFYGGALIRFHLLTGEDRLFLKRALTPLRLARNSGIENRH
jgi:O-antigen/teichoic acid export membrane protein